MTVWATESLELLFPRHKLDYPDQTEAGGVRALWGTELQGQRRALPEAVLGPAAHQAAGGEGKGGGVRAGSQAREGGAERNARRRNDQRAAETVTWQLHSGPGRHPALGHSSQ